MCPHCSGLLAENVSLGDNKHHHNAPEFPPEAQLWRVERESPEAAQLQALTCAQWVTEGMGAALGWGKQGVAVGSFACFKASLILSGAVLFLKA